MHNMQKLFIAAMLAGMALQPVQAQDAPRGDAKTGRDLYISTGCYQCHGYSGAGSSQGSRLISPPAYARFLAQLRKPASVMPPYHPNVLNDAQVADIYAYIQSLPKPPDPDSIQLLK